MEWNYIVGTRLVLVIDFTLWLANILYLLRIYPRRCRCFRIYSSLCQKGINLWEQQVDDLWMEMCCQVSVAGL